ncbi:MAG: cell division protein ZapA [Thermodesulfobacteriota bacterium]
MEQTVTIQLFGRPYTFKAETEDSKAREVADYLVNEVAKVEGKHTNQTSDISKLAILISAALNITNEHVELKRNHSSLLQDISERSANLIRLLDQKVR